MQEPNNLPQLNIFRSLAQEIFESEYKILKIKDDSMPIFSDKIGIQTRLTNSED
ncbi:hypothetical protein MJH12_05125 [bacterium]|nr:hypothetical protein [bacterium]